MKPDMETSPRSRFPNILQPPSLGPSELGPVLKTVLLKSYGILKALGDPDQLDGPQGAATPPHEQLQRTQSDCFITAITNDTNQDFAGFDQVSSGFQSTLY